MAGFQRNGIGFFENRLFLCPGQNRGDDRLNKNIKIYINNTNKVTIICFDTDKNIQDKQKIFIYR